MNRSHYIFLFLSCFLIGMSTSAVGQSYFKILEESGKYYNQKIARFPSGDLLIGDSFLESQRTGKGGKIFATRIDHCGNIEWSYSYERTLEYMELKDVKINEKEEIYLYGSAYIGLDELIFLLKLNRDGKLQEFRLFEPETVDHFTYSIDIRNNLIMAYGLLLDFNTRKLGFIAVFNEKLNFLWGKTFTPFESSGAAIFTEDGGFLCRSGQYLYKLTGEAELQWALNLDPVSGAKPIAGPLETPDGYIFEAHLDGFSFFYKLDKTGKLVWKTNSFPSINTPADMTILEDGNFMALYSCPSGEKNELCYLLLSPSGTIVQQKKFHVGTPVQPGKVYLSLGKNEEITIVGNADQFSQNHASAPDFLMQFSLKDTSISCFYWQDAPRILPNNLNLNFIPFDTLIRATVMNRKEEGAVTTFDFEPSYRETCEMQSALTVIATDTTLECDKEWLVSLPAVHFRWEDQHWANPRPLNIPGIYRAKSISCATATVYEFHLNKPSCSCKVYLPTAFSPNHDGENDRLELYSSCTILETRIRIYNRWGAEVFHRNAPNSNWDGVYEQEESPPGVYLVRIQYILQDDTGAIQEGELVQEIVLTR